jgi:Concanavalin A-like lectin/glucanases superfamily
MLHLIRGRQSKPAAREIVLDRLPPDARALWQGCALAWPFWSVGQGHVEDTGPNRFHGVFGSNMLPSDWVSSPYGAALRWSGQTNDKLTVADPPSNHLDGTTRLSVELTFKSAVLGSAGTIYGLVGKYRPSTGLRAWRVYIDGDELALQVSSDGAANEVQVTTAANFVVGTWYHVVLTYNAGVFRVYLNGAPATVDADFGVQLSIFGGGEELKVGQRTTAAGSAESNWQGDMASLRVWTGRVLTQAEARYLYDDRWAMWNPGMWLPSLALIHSGGAAAGAWVSAGVVPAGIQSLVIPGLVNGVSYDVKSETIDQTGNRSAGSSPVTGTPAAVAAGWKGRFNRRIAQGAPLAPRTWRGGRGGR